MIIIYLICIVNRPILGYQIMLVMSYKVQGQLLSSENEYGELWFKCKYPKLRVLWIYAFNVASHVCNTCLRVEQLFTGLVWTCVNVCNSRWLTWVHFISIKIYIYVGEYIRMCICLCLRLIMFICMLYIHVESRRTCLRQGVAWMWEACRR